MRIAISLHMWLVTVKLNLLNYASFVGTSGPVIVSSVD